MMDHEEDDDILAEMLVEELEKNLGQYVNGRIVTEYRINKNWIERHTVDMDKNVSNWTRICYIGDSRFKIMVCNMKENIHEI